MSRTLMIMKVLIPLFFIATTGNLFSQDYLGLNCVGSAHSSMTTDFGGSGFELGLIYKKDISDYIALNSSINLNKARISNTFESLDHYDNEYSKTLTLKPNYLRLAFYPTLYLNESSKRFRSFFGLGLELSYLLNASFTESWSTFQLNTPTGNAHFGGDTYAYGIDFVDDKDSKYAYEIYKGDVTRTEIAWSFVGGFEIKRFLHGIFRLEFRYTKAFTYSFRNEALNHINQEWDVNEFKLRRYGIALMYLYKF